MKAKEAARWFKKLIDDGYQILTIREYELRMISIMCKALLKPKSKRVRGE